MKHSIELWKTGTWYRLARFCMYLCMNKMKPTGPVVAVSRCQSWTRHTRPLGHRSSSILLLLLLHTTVSPNVAPGLFPHDTTTTVASKLTYSQGLGSYVSRSGRVSYPPGPRASSSVGAPTLTIDDIRDFRLLSVLCEKKGNFWKLPNMWTIFWNQKKHKHSKPAISDFHGRK